MDVHSFYKETQSIRSDLHCHRDAIKNARTISDLKSLDEMVLNKLIELEKIIVEHYDSMTNFGLDAFTNGSHRNGLNHLLALKNPPSHQQTNFEPSIDLIASIRFI